MANENEYSTHIPVYMQPSMLQSLFHLFNHHLENNGAAIFMHMQTAVDIQVCRNVKSRFVQKCGLFFCARVSANCW